MKVSLLDNALWAASFAGTFILFVVLLLYRRWQQFPVFTTLIGYYVVENIIGFLVIRYDPHLYATVYWITFAFDFLLQVALIIEVARVVLRPTGTWVRDARASFLISGIVGAFIAAGLTFAVHPSVPKTIDAWGIRAYLFTSLIFCELFLVTMFSAQKLGLVWKNHVMRLGQGLTAWALISAMVDVAHSYYGTAHLQDFKTLEHVRTLAYIGAVIYWIAAFWLPEPERRELPEEMQKYLVALHAKVQYDSTQVSSAQNLR
ncbi:hypothetical protein [Alloacidobacterium sp.]|uniref:hypothetical protein n=1 Tax=Alloacidobacterium sp. TaxID=2951999 RepID=UPI002D5A360F|nr:hypothetical protein [Alloacidobacterium sp.]HYK35199.1 hypothetical protein [Alloacidobacterium sp.]